MPRIAVAWAVVVAIGVASLGYVMSRDGGDPGGGAKEGDQSCKTVVGRPAQRLRECLEELSPLALSDEASVDLADLLRGSGAKVLVAAKDADVPGQRALLADRSELQQVLLGDDEAAAAARLRDADMAAIVVHRDLTRALDRDDAVLARLAHHDFLEWFQLRWVTDDGLIYGVRRTSLRLADDIGAEILGGLRARLLGAVPGRQSWEPDGVRLLGALRLRGQSLVMRHAAGHDLEGVLDELADKIRRRWEREVETIGLGTLNDRLGDVRLEVHIVRERAPVDPRSELELFELWELGVDGATLTETTDDGERFGYLPGSEATTRAIVSAEDFFEVLADEFGWSGRRPWEREAVELTLFRAEEFMEVEPGGGQTVRLVRGNPVVAREELTEDAMRQMLIDGGEWWLRNQRPDGSFLYKYWPEENRRSEGYNEVRHILAARDLVDTWRYRRDPRYLAGARRAMDWLLQYAVTADGPRDPLLPQPDPGGLLFRYPAQTTNGVAPNQKLGTVVVALLGWVNWAQATGSHDEDERIRAMARYAVSRLAENGQFQPYDVPPGHPYYGQVNDIVPGEAALALGRVAEYFGDPQWVSFFPRFLDYYESWFRERAAKKERYGRWPEGTYTNSRRLELVQFGPWAVMACDQYFQLTGDERAARFGLEIADWIIDNYQWTDDRAPWPDFVGGYYKVPWELPAMQAFVYSEGTAAAYSIATTFRPEMAAKYEAATLRTLRFLQVMQYDDLNSYFAPRPELVRGAVRYAMNEPKIRIDYLGHAMSTLTQFLDARGATR